VRVDLLEFIGGSKEFGQGNTESFGNAFQCFRPRRVSVFGTLRNSRPRMIKCAFREWTADRGEKSQSPRGGRLCGDIMTFKIFFDFRCGAAELFANAALIYAIYTSPKHVQVALDRIFFAVGEIVDAKDFAFVFLEQKRVSNRRLLKMT